MVQLINGDYDEVYGVNGAQVNIDQLLETDESLYRYVIRKFSYKYEDIDSIPPEKLKKKSKNIMKTKA